MAGFLSCNEGLLRVEYAKSQQTLAAQNDLSAIHSFQQSLTPSSGVVGQAVSGQTVDLSSAQVKIAFGKLNPTDQVKNQLTNDEILGILSTPDSQDKLKWAFTIRRFRVQAMRELEKLKSQLVVRNLIHVGQRVARITRFVPQVLTTNAAPSAASSTSNWVDDFKTRIQSFLGAAFNLISPISLPKRVSSEMDAIFLQLEKNPNLELTSENRSILSNDKALEAYEARTSFLKNAPWAPQYIARPIKTVQRIVSRVSLVLALYLSGLPQLGQQGLISIADFLSRPEYQLGDQQIQILSETAPIPHLAIRIHDRVYSYGFTSMLVRPVSSYLTERELELEQARSSPTSNWDDVWNQEMVRARSVEVLTLNLSKEEVNRLQFYLAMQKYKTYQNFTFANDCSSMIAKALNENTSIHVPEVVDPSPAMMMMYLVSTEMTGSRFGSYRMVAAHPEGQRARYLLQALYMNFKDAYLYQRLFVLSQLNRGALEIAAGDLQFQEAGALDEFRKVNDDVLEEMKQDPLLAYYLKMSHQKNAAGYSTAMAEAQQYFEKEYGELHRLVTVDDVDILSILRAHYRATLLGALEKEILGKTSYQLKNEFKDPATKKQFEQLIQAGN